MNDTCTFKLLYEKTLIQGLSHYSFKSKAYRIKTVENLRKVTRNVYLTKTISFNFGAPVPFHKDSSRMSTPDKVFGLMDLID